MRIALAALFVAWATPAHAQITPRTPRPDWSLFGSGVADTGQKLILTANFGGGYEDDLTKVPLNLPASPEGTQPAYTGPFGSAGASLGYSVDKDGLRANVSFSAAGRNYRDQDQDPFVGTYSLNGSVAWDVSSRGSLVGSMFAGQYVQSLAPGYVPGAGGPSYPGVPTIPGDPGVYTNGDTYIGIGTSLSYDHRITTKVSAYAGWSYYLNDAWQDADASTSGDYGAQNLNGGLRYAIAKGLSARVGYGGSVSGFNDDDFDFRGRSIDVGLDYSGSLSPTRRSTLSFSSGVSGIQDLNSSTHYYLVGGVNYSYEIGRTWSAGVGVHRNTDFYQTLGQPSVSDSVHGSIGGSVGRRVTLTFGGGWYRGKYAGADAEAYTSSNASASAQYALSRFWSLGATYSYYRYEYAPDVIIPPGFSDATARQSIRVSLNTFLPLFKKARRP